MFAKHTFIAMLAALASSCSPSVPPQGTLYTGPFAHAGIFDVRTGAIRIDYHLNDDGSMKVSLVNHHKGDNEYARAVITGEGVQLDNDLFRGWKMMPDGSLPLEALVKPGAADSAQPHLFVAVWISSELVMAHSEPLVIDGGKLRPCASGECPRAEGKSLEPPLQTDPRDEPVFVVHCFYPEDAAGSIPVTCEAFPLGLTLESRFAIDVAADGARIAEGQHSELEFEHRKPRQYDTQFVLEPTAQQVELHLRVLECESHDDCKEEKGKITYRLAVDGGHLHLCQGTDPKCPPR